MAKSLQILPKAEAGKTLSKIQKEFNSLVKKINSLRLEIEKVKELDLELRKLGETRVIPADKLVSEAKRVWVFTLHNHPARAKLNKKQEQQFAILMQEGILELLETTFFSDDQELRTIFKEYDSEGRSYDEVEEARVAEAKEEAIEMAQQMFGIDLDLEDLEDPEKLFEKVEAKRLEFEEQARAKSEKKAKKKAAKPESAAQQAAEAKRLESETAVKKTAKQLYLDLVKHFHPDREPDEQKRAEKTEIMKQITAAYDADDHLRLLELQMTLLKAENNVFSDFNEQELRYFNASLKKQVMELQQEYFSASPNGNGNIFAFFFKPDKKMMKSSIDRYVREQKKVLKDIEHNISVIELEMNFTEYIREYSDPRSYWGY